MSKELFKIRESLINVVEFYSYREYELGKNSLSDEQRQQLTEVRDRLNCFGEIGLLWAGLATEILSA